MDPQALELANKTLAAAIDSLMTMGSPFVPIVLVEKDGTRELQRVVADRVEEAAAMARQIASSHEDADATGFAVDGFITHDGTRTDGIIVEAWNFLTGKGARIGLRYELKGTLRKKPSLLGSPLYLSRSGWYDPEQGEPEPAPPAPAVVPVPSIDTLPPVFSQQPPVPTTPSGFGPPPLAGSLAPTDVAPPPPPSAQGGLDVYTEPPALPKVFGAPPTGAPVVVSPLEAPPASNPTTFGPPPTTAPVAFDPPAGFGPPEGVDPPTSGQPSQFGPPPSEFGPPPAAFPPPLLSQPEPVDPPQAPAPSAQQPPVQQPPVQAPPVQAQPAPAPPAQVQPAQFPPPLLLPPAPSPLLDTAPPTAAHPVELPVVQPEPVIAPTYIPVPIQRSDTPLGNRAMFAGIMELATKNRSFPAFAIVQQDGAWEQVTMTDANIVDTAASVRAYARSRTDAEFIAFAVDSFVPVDGVDVTAVVVEVWEYATRVSFSVAQRYVPTGDPPSPRLSGRPLMRTQSGWIDVPSAMNLGGQVQFGYKDPDSA